MARKILVVYLLYTVIVFLFYSYIIKEDYINALIKSIISGIVFTVLYAFLMMRNEKKQLEEKEKAIPQKKKP